MKTTSNRTDALARDLVQALNDLIGLHGELAMHMGHKLDAVKRADSDAIQSITARETTLAERVEQRDGLRRQLVRALLESLGQTEDPSRPTRLTELAEHLREPRRSQVLVAAAGLREKLTELDRMRVTTTLITNEMLRHLQDVLDVMTSGGAAADVYGRTGRRERSASANVFEAVG